MNFPHRILFTQLSHHSSAGAYYQAHSGWRSPMVFLFVGVAAMLLLTGFASLILVCTWCRLANNNTTTTMAESSVSAPHSGPLKPQQIVVDDEEKGENILVIMPGDLKPSFLAIEMSSAVLATENTEMSCVS